MAIGSTWEQAAIVGSAPSDATLLESKLVPPHPAVPPVLRHRLLGVLSAGVARTPVTLISGPAGSGKTVLAASWVSAGSHRGPVAWVSLDEADDDPATFWAYVVEALGQAGLDMAGVPRSPAGEPVTAGLTTAVIARILAGSRPVVLVLDNADCLTDVEICRGLDLLVRHAAPRLRLVLCARADPQLPLHQYRLGELLTEIRGGSLAFDADETRELLAALGTPVPPEVAADLQARTEGWAVGVRLAAAPLKRGTDPEQLIASLAEEDGSVAQYLFAEVLERQPAPVRRFLLRISVTDALWPELVEQLSPRSNGRRILGSLARANAFVEQSVDAPGGYRIHPLFREMLKAQLQFDHPRDVPALHQVCATWNAVHGHRHAAIGHAIEAGDWQLATQLVVDELLVAAMLVHEADPCLRVLEGMPPDIPGAEAAVIRLATSLAPRRAAAPGDVALARAAAEDEGHRLALRVCSAVAVLCVEARDGAASEQLAADTRLAERLVERLPDERDHRRRELAAAVALARSFTLLNSDAPDDLLAAGLRAALGASTAARSSRLRSRLLGLLALVEALRGELCSAVRLAEEAGGVAGDRGVPRVERYPAAAAALAWVSVERYDHAQARRWIARAHESVPDPERPWILPLLAVLQSRLFRLRHEFAAAADILRPHLADGSLPRWIRMQVVAESVRGHLAEGTIDAALRLLGEAGDGGPLEAVLRGAAAVADGRPVPALPGEAAAASPVLAVEADLIRTCDLVRRGSGPAAVECLHRALERAEPEWLRQPFLDAPAPVRRLLRGQPRLAQGAAWLSPSAPGTPDHRPAQHTEEAPPPRELLQPLSERELEVLQHLAELLSTAEIAAALFVSVNTVRTHIRSILRKLSVSRRNQAVRRARELGVL